MLLLLAMATLTFHSRAVAEPSAVPGVAASEHGSGTSLSYTLPPEKLAKARSLYHLETALEFGSFAWSVLVLLLLLNLRWAARLGEWTTGLSRNLWLQGCCFAPLLLGLIALLHLPLAVAAHHTSLAYGLSIQRWGSWLLDWGKAFLLNLGTGTVVLLFLFALIRASRRWWLWFWIVSLPVQVLVVFLIPVVIDPLFNRFEPLARSSPALVQQLERVVSRTGVRIPPARMYLMHASEKVTMANAYVTGYGASKRVVVWDTALRTAPTDEILVIFGHELGHYVLEHIQRGLIIASVLTFFFFYAGSRLAVALIRRYGARWHIASIEKWPAAAVVLLVASLLGFLATPLSNSVSRVQEHQADMFGEEVVCGIVADPQHSAAASFQRLGEQTLDYPNPNPLVVFWTFSHPPTAQRMAFAATFDACRPDRQRRFVAMPAGPGASLTR